MTPHPATPSLRPLAGTAAEVYALLDRWLFAHGDVEPLIVQTSGSTGAPRGVLLSRDAVTASARATEARLGGPGHWLLDLPPTYVAGSQVLVRSLLAGTTPVYASEYESFAEAAGALAGLAIGRTYVSIVPTQLKRALDDQAATDALAGFDAVLIGGAFTPPELRARAEAAGINVVRTYGMSETSGGCVYDGLPLDGVGVRIGADRRVHLSGPLLCDGYAGDPEATAEVLRDGWFATQDLGELDNDGRLRLIGRMDDVVISGGVNVALPAVARAVAGCAGVEDAEVLGVDDPEWGTRVVAYVVGEVTLDAIRDGVEAAGCPRTWAPRQLVCLDALPLLANGKVDRQALHALA